MSPTLTPFAMAQSDEDSGLGRSDTAPTFAKERIKTSARLVGDIVALQWLSDNFL